MNNLKDINKFFKEYYADKIEELIPQGMSLFLKFPYFKVKNDKLYYMQGNKTTEICKIS